MNTRNKLFFILISLSFLGIIFGLINELNKSKTTVYKLILEQQKKSESTSTTTIEKNYYYQSNRSGWEDYVIKLFAFREYNFDNRTPNLWVEKVGETYQVYPSKKSLTDNSAREITQVWLPPSQQFAVVQFDTGNNRYHIVDLEKTNPADVIIPLSDFSPNNLKGEEQDIPISFINDKYLLYSYTKVTKTPTPYSETDDGEYKTGYGLLNILDFSKKTITLPL